MKIVRTEKEAIDSFTTTGDLSVLGELYSGYMTRVYGVCLKYMRDREEAKDAVMHIFEKLIKEIPRQKIDNFGSWLHVVTKNYCLMQLRSEKSRSERFNEWMEYSLIFVEKEEELHPVDKEGAREDEDLNDCISKLKDEQKECIRLFYFENKCYNDIAAITACDVKKVKSYIQNAKRNLKICLEDKHAEE